MNSFKRKALLAAVLITVADLGDSLVRYARQNAVRLTLAALVLSAVGLGVVDPSAAMAGGMLLMAGNAPFYVQPELTAIALAYANRTAIADNVLPRMPVGKQEFTYIIHTMAEGFTVPDTKVGRRSSPGQVEFTGTNATSQTYDFGLDDVVPQNDIDNAPPNYDPIGKAVAFLTNLIVLDREIRCASLIFNTASYAAANTATLSGTSQWSDYTNSDPLSAIMNALDGVTIRPNVAVFGRATWTKLRMHPKIVQAVTGVYQGAGGSSAGSVSRQQVADLLELDEVLVGESFYNTARKGQTASLSRVWGKHASFIYRDLNALAGKGITFGFTAQWGSRVAGSWPVKENAGIKGGSKIRVGESVNEVVCANDVGYMFQNAVA